MKTLSQQLGTDLSNLIPRDIPNEVIVGNRKLICLQDDTMNDEVDGFGGPERVEIQRLHFLTSDLESVEDGSIMFFNGKSRIVVNSVTSACGNELIVTVRGA